MYMHTGYTILLGERREGEGKEEGGRERGRKGMGVGGLKRGRWRRRVEFCFFGWCEC